MFCYTYYTYIEALQAVCKDFIAVSIRTVIIVTKRFEGHSITANGKAVMLLLVMLGGHSDDVSDGHTVDGSDDCKDSHGYGRESGPGSRS